MFTLVCALTDPKLHHLFTPFSFLFVHLQLIFYNKNSGIFFFLLVFSLLLSDEQKTPQDYLQSLLAFKGDFES